MSSQFIKNPGKTLVETIWGTNFFDSLPAKWKSSLKMKRYKTSVPNGTLPDEIGEVNLENLMDEIVATSQVTTDRTNELKKITEKIQVALLLTSTTQGQELDREFNLPIPFSEHLALTGVEIGDASKEITPLNTVLCEVKSYDTTAFDAAMAAYHLDFESTGSLDIPDILTGITIVKETSTVDGTSTDTVSSVSGSGAFAFTVPLRAEAQGSAGITGEVVPHLVPLSTRRTVKNFMFFLKSPVTTAQITAKLETLSGLSVTNLANFKPGYVTVVLICKKQSVQASAGHTFHFELNSSGGMAMHSHSSGSSKSSVMEVKTVRIPPTLHGAIILKDEAGSPISLTSTTTSSVAAHISEFTGDVSIGAVDVPITATGSMRIMADGLEATEGGTDLPDSGLLILDTDARPFKYGWVMIHVPTIDASTL